MSESIEQRIPQVPGFPVVGKTPQFNPLGSLQIEVKAARMGILGMAPVFPAERYTQAEVLAALGYAGNETAEKIFAGTGIETRHMSVPLSALPFPEGKAQHELARAVLNRLTEQAVRSVQRQTSLDMKQVGCLIVNSSSGFHMPGLSAGLVNALRLPPHIAKYDLTGAGCVGALPGLALADDYLKAHPEKRVLFICVDVCSLGLRPGEPDDKETMVVNALFGDAAVAMVLGAAGADAGMPEFVDVNYLQGYDMLESACVTMEPGGVFGAHLKRELPEHSASLFGPAVDELLANNRLTRQDIKHWVFHPGGPAILNKLQETFGLSDDQLAPSRETLRTCGNTSSPTCLIALNHLVHERRPQPGEWGILGAIGPGLTVGVALLQW
jgi:predicted naringenin-chalcone synthase